MYVLEVSENLLLKIKKQEPAEALLQQLATLPLADFTRQLADDTSKKAFWINCYNAFFLYLRRDQKIQKPDIYRRKLIKVAGLDLSLDDIEHGILRKYRYKWSLGFFPNPLAPAIIKKLAVTQLDHRIHFALNCGAKSCPPIAFYQKEKIEQQLDMATRSFLESETQAIGDAVHISRLFLWYLGDFGGYTGIRQILNLYLDLAIKGKKLVFKPYDYEEDLENFL